MKISRKRKISSVLWANDRSGKVYLTRDWKATDSLPPLYLGYAHAPLASLSREDPVKFGERAHYFYNKRSLQFMICPDAIPNFDLKNDKVYLAGSFSGWTEAMGDADWQLKKEKINGKLWLTKRVSRRWLGDFEHKHGPLLFKFLTSRNQWIKIDQAAPNRYRDPRGIENYRVYLDKTGRHVFNFDFPEGHKRSDADVITWSTPQHQEAVNLPPTGDFLKLHSDARLGPMPGSSGAKFRIFAPRAQTVEIITFTKLDESDKIGTQAQRQPYGIWEVEVPEVQEGHFYYYHINGENRDASTAYEEGFKIIDPYALAMASATGPGIVKFKESIDKFDDGFKPPQWHDLVMMECHLGDIVEHAPVSRDDKVIPGYREMIEFLQQDNNYIEALGVNAIEIQPLQQMDKVKPQRYHWGYMTVNYFSPESSYAISPEAGSQIKEMQELVKTAHSKGLSVILDVVYNHVGEPNFLYFVDKLYYFETDPNFNLMNWSGCGNDLRCGAPMVKRLIIDSLIHWIEYLGVDGFRFDLAELIGVDVLKEIEEELKKVKPSVILIAEPWSFRGHIGSQLMNTGYASWNDGYRNFVYEYVLAKGNQDGIKYFLKGSRNNFARFPAQTVNYTESHDDRCWLDRITENSDNNGYLPLLVDRRRTHLMMSILMVSVGIPMIAEGQDFLRSKRGVNNTYLRGDLNALEYDRLTTYAASHEYTRNWIHFRRSPKGHLLRLNEHPTNEFFEAFTVDNVSSIAMLYNANFERGSQQLLYAVNPHHHGVLIPVSGIQARKFVQLADHERFDANGLKAALIRWTPEGIWLPPLTCGFWTSKD
ncbi:MAG: alpha-amylase family glycosyl hydrolase [Opitutales bacterium]